MFGLFGVFGPVTRDFPVERFRDLWVPNSKLSVKSNNTSFAIARYVPEDHSENPTIHSSGDDNLYFAMDGYVITQSAQTTSGLHAQIESLVDNFQRKGIHDGLDDLAAGSYIMMVLDASKQQAHVITDPIGSLAVYKSKVGKSWIVSTNPVALARTGLIDSALDMTACAEWALFAYALGERYPLRGIRTIPPGTIYSIDLRSGNSKRERFESISEISLGEQSPSVEETAEAFKKACTRLMGIDPRPAQLQSSGMDSRLITASLPEGCNPACYTYGNPDSHEIRIARMIAAKRGSRWFHTWQHGDEVADIADSMFQESGIIMWPDRRFVAEKIASNDHMGVFDGLADIGGALYCHDRYFGFNKNLKRIFARSYDVKYSQFSMNQIVEAIYEDILQVKNFGNFRHFLNDDSISTINTEKTSILQDIWNCIQDTKPELDSMALLWRNFHWTTRVSHYTIQQGIMCKKYVNVYYPFTNDREFNRLAMSIQPKDAMYWRYYIRLYRRCHPVYAEIPYGATLLPIRRPVLNHKLSKILLSMNLSIPYLTGSSQGKVRDPNGWSIWLEESAKLRDYVQSSLESACMLDKSRADQYFKDIASGKIKGSGKLFHLASIAKWMTISKSSN